MAIVGYARVSTEGQNSAASLRPSRPPERPRSIGKRSRASGPIARSLPSSWLAWALVTLWSSPSLIGSAGRPASCST